MSVTITLATRGRPAILRETVTRTLPNMVRADTLLILAIDADDTETVAAVESEEFPRDNRMIVDIRDREDTVGAKWNRGYDFYPAELHTYQADYTTCITPGFDERMLDAARLFPDGIGFVFSRMANPTFACTYGMTRKLCDKLGWMFPPFFPYWFVDHWADDLARLIDRISFADVEYVWPEKKNPTHEFREVNFWATFYDSLRLVRRRQAFEIIDAMDEPEWRKELLRRQYPLVEHRSQSINDMVRAMNAPDLAGPGDDRYWRVKSAALAMMRAEWPELEAELKRAA